MIKRIDLLVHAGAPSSRKDDDRYRAQAEAYASFEPAVITTLDPLPRSVENLDSRLPSNSDKICNATGDDGCAPNLYLDDTQLAYTVLDSQLLTSSLLCAQSFEMPLESRTRAAAVAPSSKKRKRISQPVHHACDLQRDFESLKPGNFTTGDNNSNDEASTTSSYLKSPELQRASKQVRPSIQRVSISFEPAPQRDNQINAARTSQDLQHAPSVPKALIQPGARSADSNSANQTTSELPTSYSVSDLTSGSSRAKARPNSHRSSSDPGPQIESISPTALRAVQTPQKLQDLEVHRAGNAEIGDVLKLAPERIEGRRHLVAVENAPGSAQSAVASAIAPPASSGSKMPDRRTLASSTKPLDNRNAAPPTSSSTHERALEDLSVSIQAPEPSTALEEFKTHITDPLRFLADNIDVNKAYKPISVSRDLRPLERGHWLVQCPETSEGWSLHSQIEFWRFLERTIGKGNAGWSVWCSRNDEKIVVNDARASIGDVKVFCWGEIVRHIYLLLYVGSRSKIKKLGLQWIDADGQVIVQMRHAP